MKTQRTWKLQPLAAAAVALLVTLLLPATAAAQPFNCLPSCATDDGRSLAIAAGGNFQTLSDPVLDLTFVVPAGTSSFEIGVFDGDAQGVFPASDGLRHWDSGNPGLPAPGGIPTFPERVPIFEYTVFADPNANVSGTQVVAGPFIGTSDLGSGDMLNNAWFDIPINTGPEAQSASGDFVYRLRIELKNPDTTLPGEMGFLKPS